MYFFFVSCLRFLLYFFFNSLHFTCVFKLMHTCSLYSFKIINPTYEIDCFVLSIVYIWPGVVGLREEEGEALGA